eukprot:m.67088 g.67088  ORF g.67088 m.67088 type:complete len:373 (+) comp7653_c0_seq1:1196-2314(+)
MGGRVDLVLERVVEVGLLADGIENAQTHLHLEEIDKGTVDGLIRDGALGDRIVEMISDVGTAINVHACLESHLARFLGSRRVVMRFDHILHSAAIACDVALKAPRVAGNVGHDFVIGTRWHPVDFVVAAHCAPSNGSVKSRVSPSSLQAQVHTQRRAAALANACFKGREVGIGNILGCCLGVVVVAIHAVPVFQVVVKVVLAAARGLEVVHILALLEARDKVGRVLARSVGILARCLLAAAPAWIADNVDVRSPEGEAGMAGVVEGAGFSGDGGANAAPERLVEGRGSADDLREGRCIRRAGIKRHTRAVANAVQSLAPPLVRWNLQRGDATGTVDEEASLVAVGNASHDVACASLQRLGWIAGRGSCKWLS